MLKHSLPSTSFQLSRKILLGVPLAAVLFAAPLLAGPDEGGLPGFASDTITAELIRRQAATTEARLLMEEGDRLMADEKLSEGVAKYRQAAETLPEAPMTSALRQMAAARLANASLVLARRLGSEGNFPEANAVIDTALIHSVDHPQLLEVRKQLLDPNYYNPAMTPDQKDRIRKINTLFELAEGFMNLGQPDPAMASYNQILGMDPTNTAARRGLERCERYIVDYQKSARDHTRARALREVDAQWETSVPTNTMVERLPQEDAAKDPLTSGLTAKLRGLVFPRVSFDGATLDEVVQYLSSQTKLLDPEQRGVNLVLRLGQRRGSDLPRINIDVNNVPLDQVLVFVTEQTGTRWQIVDGLVVITGLSDGGGKLISRTYPVPPDFLSGAPVAEAETADPFATSGAEKPPGAVTRVTAKSFLEASGVKFPAGAKAEFLRTVSKLVVFNTEENHDIVQGVLDQITSKTPRQALIRVSLLQASENHLEELGFDWLLGAFNIGTSGLFGSGGSNGNSGLGGAQASDWSAFSPTSGTIPTPIGQNPITAGNRSSADLQSNLSIDDVLAGVRRIGPATRSPGAFAITGAFTDPQFQTVIRALNQKKAVDFSAATSVIVKSGQIAKAQSIREIMVPTDYDPPQIPQSFGNNQNQNQNFNPVNQGNNAPAATPVVPATPTEFEMVEVGLNLEVEATIPEEGNVVEITVSPDYSEFEGFVNYGSPILTGAAGGTTIQLTENAILQHVVRHLRMQKTTLSVYDGATFVIGGLSESRVTAIEDKVPLLGDVPLLGRLFRSKATSNSRKAILFFVSVNLLDPAGRRTSDFGNNITIK